MFKTTYEKEREKALNHRRRQEAYKAFCDELGWSGSRNIFRAFEKAKKVTERFDELTKRA